MIPSRGHAPGAAIDEADAAFCERPQLRRTTGKRPTVAPATASNPGLDHGSRGARRIGGHVGPPSRVGRLVAAATSAAADSPGSRTNHRAGPAPRRQARRRPGADPGRRARDHQARSTRRARSGRRMTSAKRSSAPSASSSRSGRGTFGRWLAGSRPSPISSGGPVNRTARASWPERRGARPAIGSGTRRDRSRPPSSRRSTPTSSTRPRRPTSRPSPAACSDRVRGRARRGPARISGRRVPRQRRSDFVLHPHVRLPIPPRVRVAIDRHGGKPAWEPVVAALGKRHPRPLLPLGDGTGDPH